MVELSFGVLDGELIQPVDNAQFTITNRPVLFVKAEANGLIGYGECAALLEPLQGDASLGGVLDQLRSVGKDRIARALRTRGGELLAPGMVASLFGTDATSRSVAAMLEMAFFDLQLKTQRQSLASWLKVTATDVEAGGFVAVHGGVTREEFEQRASDLADAGIRRFRLKIRPGFDHTPVHWLRSLLPDAIDADAEKPAGLYSAWMVFAQKICISVALFLFGNLMSLTGYAASSGILQPASALTAIRLCMGLIPAVLVVLALLVMRRWPRQPSSALPAT